MKVACIIAALLFSLFAYWQFNDRPQYGTEFWQGWVLLYVFTAVVSLVTAFRDIPRWIYIALAAGTLANGIYRFTAIEWEKTVLFNEGNPAGNEAGGLFIVCLWAGFLWWKAPQLGKGEPLV